VTLIFKHALLFASLMVDGGPHRLMVVRSGLSLVYYVSETRKHAG
jgi:hypothetical protein